MRFRLTIASLLAFLGCNTALSAHPHIFVDTTLQLEFSQEGLLKRIGVTWAYDPFYSLLITEDLGIFPDPSGKMNTEELARLRGFDMKWVAGFNGDLVVEQNGIDIALSGPSQIEAVFQNDQIVTTHWRALSRLPEPGQEILIKPFDPTYYTAYSVSDLPRVIGDSSCNARVKVPEMTGPLQGLQSLLSTLDADKNPEDVGLPNIGEKLADVVVVTCD